MTTDEIVIVLKPVEGKVVKSPYTDMQPVVLKKVCGHGIVLHHPKKGLCILLSKYLLNRHVRNLATLIT